jgi:hypothetical protein
MANCFGPDIFFSFYDRFVTATLPQSTLLNLTSFRSCTKSSRSLGLSRHSSTSLSFPWPPKIFIMLIANIVHPNNGLMHELIHNALKRRPNCRLRPFWSQTRNPRYTPLGRHNSNLDKGISNVGLELTRRRTDMCCYYFLLS